MELNIGEEHRTQYSGVSADSGVSGMSTARDVTDAARRRF